jgi:pyrroline-5-carboxylate reductase
MGKAIAEVANVEKRIYNRSDDYRDVLECECLLLAVKPKDLQPVLEKLQSSLQNLANQQGNDSDFRKGLTIISVIASKSVEYLRSFFEGLPFQINIVRAMPNLAVSCQYGSMAIFESRSPKNNKGVDLVRQLFEEHIQIDELKTEEEFDAYTALVGSGIAYYFAFAKAMEETGRSFKFSEEFLKRITLQTFLGAASYAESRFISQGNEIDWSSLISQVASKGGVTEEALKAFEENSQNANLTSIVDLAVENAFIKSQQMGKTQM